jgi:hypothetical protein
MPKPRRAALRKEKKKNKKERDIIWKNTGKI